MNNLYIYFSNSSNNSIDGTANLIGNLGDLSGYYILKHFIKKEKLNINLIPINQKSPKIENEKIICLIGSVLEHIPTRFDSENVCFFSCGKILEKELNLINNKTKIIGVRGNMTKNTLIINKDIKILSDLGLLLSEYYLLNNKPYKEIGYIIHSVDREEFIKNYPHLEKDIINNYTTPELFLEKFSQYEKIISSSLHGIIFSHSFNKPVVPVKITNKIIGGDFKFSDYYSSLGMTNIKRIDYNLLNYNNIENIFNKFNIDQNIINNIKNEQIIELKKYFRNEGFCNYS